MEIDHFADGEDVIFDMENEVTHVLNYSAAIALRIRLEYDEASYFPIDEFKKEIMEKMVNVNDADLELDFNDVIGELLEKGIIEIYEE